MTSGERKLAPDPVWYNVTQRSFQTGEKVDYFAEWSCNSTDISEAGLIWKQTQLIGGVKSTDCRENKCSTSNVTLYGNIFSLRFLGWLLTTFASY